MSSRTTFSLKRWLKRFIPTGSSYADSSNLDAAGLPLNGILGFVLSAVNISSDFESKAELVSLGFAAFADSRQCSQNSGDRMFPSLKLSPRSIL